MKRDTEKLYLIPQESGNASMLVADILARTIWVRIWSVIDTTHVITSAENDVSLDLCLKEQCDSFMQHWVGGRDIDIFNGFRTI